MTVWSCTENLSTIERKKIKNTQSSFGKSVRFIVYALIFHLIDLVVQALIEHQVDDPPSCIVLILSILLSSLSPLLSLLCRCTLTTKCLSILRQVFRDRDRPTSFSHNGSNDGLWSAHRFSSRPGCDPCLPYHAGFYALRHGDEPASTQLSSATW
jgi:hypothetical protein